MECKNKLVNYYWYNFLMQFVISSSSLNIYRMMYDADIFIHFRLIIFAVAIFFMVLSSINFYKYFYGVLKVKFMKE